jgi:hypothetical protein
MLDKVDIYSKELCICGITGYCWLSCMAACIGHTGQNLLYSRMIQQQLLLSWTPDGQGIVVKNLLPFAKGPDDIILYPDSNGKVRIEFTGELAFIPGAIKLLYLPGTLTFDNLVIV